MSIRVFVNSLLTSAVVLAISGCGVITSPGFDFAEPGQRTSITLGQYIPTDVDNSPEGIVIPISKNLIDAVQVAQPTKLPEDVQKLIGVAPSYTIGAGDVVGVIVYDHPELLPNAGAVITQQTDPTGVNVAPGFIVGSNGEISFPYVGRVRLAGLNEIEASDLITKRIAQYIRDPQVTVRIQSFRSRRAYVEGEVKIPGMQIFTDIPMTLAEAISRAGGIVASGDRSFLTLGRDGKTTRIDLDLLEGFNSGAENIPLQNGDRIYVRNRDESKVYVMGEIVRPSALLMHSGRLSLNEALGEAGGPNLSTANPGQIYVIRKNAQGAASVFHLDAKNPTAFALADQFPLRPRDVVYIDPVPLVQWNRIVSLILPSAQAVYFGSQATVR